MAIQYVNSTVQGLGTIATFIAPSTDVYSVQGSITLPTIGNGGVASGATPSQVVATVNKNGSAQYTGFAGAEGFQTNVQCTAADTITVVLSSSNTALDGMLNVIKTTVSISEGV